MPGAALRLRQVTALARPAARAVSWQPQARMMVAGIGVVALGSRAGVMTRLSVASAAVAATTAFMLDDPAAVTLAASPTSLPVRCLQRACAAVLGTGLWWAAAAALAEHRVGDLPLGPLTLEFAMFVTVAMAASAAAATMGDRTGGGIPGATFTLVCFATTYLPPRSWLPFPAEPGAPGAPARLVAVLAIAVTVLFVMSRDPASRGRRRLLGHQRRWTGDRL
jgi:hypothetical protein